MKPILIQYFRPLWLLTLLCLCDPAAAQATHKVDVSHPAPLREPHAFFPNDLTIQVGDTVKWVKERPRYSEFIEEYNVTADDFSFASPTWDNFVYSHTFTKAGEILYHCSVHSSPGKDRNQFMNGRIIVQGGDGGSASNLALQSVHATSGAYRPGDAIPIDLTIENAGGQASGAYSVTYYASGNGIIDTSDIALGTDNRPSVNAHESSSFRGNAVLPAGIAGVGSWLIGAIINVSDANDDNNVGIDSVFTSFEFPINAGLNDIWHNMDIPGQGFFISVFPDTSPARPEPVMFVAWFTYDLERPPADVTAILGEPGHRWLTAYGPYSGGTATLDIELTQGGIFNSGVPAPTQGPYGTMIVKFTSCSEGVVTYDIPSVGVAGVAGVVPIERVANDNVAFCEALQTP